MIFKGAVKVHESRSFDTYQRSTFLFPDTGFLHGLARLVDFGKSLDQYNTTPASGDADTRALVQDWLAVGDDIRGAMNEIDIDA